MIKIQILTGYLIELYGQSFVFDIYSNFKNIGLKFIVVFCVSATTGVAALKSNRRFVGIDAEKEYLDMIAIPRIKVVFNEEKWGSIIEK